MATPHGGGMPQGTSQRCRAPPDAGLECAPRAGEVLRHPEPQAAVDVVVPATDVQVVPTPARPVDIAPCVHSDAAQAFDGGITNQKQKGSSRKAEPAAATKIRTIRGTGSFRPLLRDSKVQVNGTCERLPPADQEPADCRSPVLKQSLDCRQAASEIRRCSHTLPMAVHPRGEYGSSGTPGHWGIPTKAPSSRASPPLRRPGTWGRLAPAPVPEVSIGPAYTRAET